MLRRPDTASSPRGVLRRASAEPLLRVSLSSALAPSRPLLICLFVALCVIGIYASITRLETGYIAETSKYAAKNEATAGCLPKKHFSLERIPSRYGTGYKAKMKRRETRTAEECARLDTRLRGMPHNMMVIHCEAVLDAMFKIAAETGCICRLGDYLTIDPHVRGHFDEPTDRFDPRKGHSVSFTIKPGRKLKTLLATFMPINKTAAIFQSCRA